MFKTFHLYSPASHHQFWLPPLKLAIKFTMKRHKFYLKRFLTCKKEMLNLICSMALRVWFILVSISRLIIKVLDRYKNSICKAGQHLTLKTAWDDPLLDRWSTSKLINLLIDLSLQPLFMIQSYIIWACAYEKYFFWSLSLPSPLLLHNLVKQLLLFFCF